MPGTRIDNSSRITSLDAPEGLSIEDPGSLGAQLIIAFILVSTSLMFFTVLRTGSSWAALLVGLFIALFWAGLFAIGNTFLRHHRIVVDRSLGTLTLSHRFVGLGQWQHDTQLSLSAIASLRVITIDDSDAVMRGVEAQLHDNTAVALITPGSWHRPETLERVATMISNGAGTTSAATSPVTS